MNRKKQFSLLKIRMLIMGIMIFSGCTLTAEENIPYGITGQMVIDESSGYDNAVFNFSFVNNSDKTVKNFTLVFFLFDEDGSVPVKGAGSIVTKISCNVENGKSLEGSVSLEEYLNYIPEEPYEADYIYISQIEYSDNTQWSDPFGLYAF